eukprot:TRINITY_DN481_c0_g1_i8.p1 TRINITY_DN481_c0_g1~~TRINITY_DN481_c0_g1_i8.p1  ORF type:complete len:107 (-),score=8.82 TRINITY_DN481_c0_g1_i8:31-351(-)
MMSFILINCYLLVLPSSTRTRTSVRRSVVTFIWVWQGPPRPGLQAASRAAQGPRSPPAPRHTAPATAVCTCLLYTSDAADEEDSVDLGGRRIIKKKKKTKNKDSRT